MAKGKGDIKGWITKNGVHIPIYGQYTVRGGVEPKAKGAKWKRKRPNDLKANDIHGQERLINRKDLEDALTEAKSKAKNATNENEWRQYENEAKDIQKALDGKEVSPLVASNYGKLSAKKKPSMSEEDKTARTVADHYGVSLQEAKEGINSGKYTEDNIKEAKDYKATMKDIEDKRDAGSISVEDYESARRDAIKGFNESRKAEGKKLTSFQEQVNDRFKTKREWDEIAKNAGYKDSSDPEFQKNADDIVAKNKQVAKDEKEAKTIAAIAGLYQAEKQEQASSKVASNGAPRVSDEDAGRNQEVEWNGGKYQTQQVVDWDNDKKQEYVAGHLYVPVDPKNGEKQFFVSNEDGSVYNSGSEYFRQKNSKADMRDETKSLGDGGKVTSRIKTQEQAYVDDAFKPQVSEKERKMQGLRDAESAYVNEAFKGNTKQVSSKSSSIEERIMQGLRKQGVPESAVAKEAFNLKKGFAEGSIAPEELKSLGITSDEMKLLQSNEKISAMSRYASGKDKTTFIDPMGNLMQTRNRSAYERNTGMDFAKDIGKGNIQDAIDREKAERAKVYDRVKGNPEGTTKSPMVVRDMTPSGLRSAWETATGSEKTKISSELHRRGYTYVGGKWVKA